MKKLLRTITAAMALTATVASVNANPGWPANYEGVMLQGFYWDSFNDGYNFKYLTDNVDEFSPYFKLIWVPNSAYTNDLTMGYAPVYWFEQRSNWGSRNRLTRMIETYKAKGVGFIEDVVINHRSGLSTWTDFPAETWNGVTYQMGPADICSTDEVSREPGQAKPTGAADTGDDFNGSRDLDHTGANVQKNCKAYCKFLLDEIGYVGFRLDMVKGYAPQYTKMYNEYSQPTYCVGEFFDYNYDSVKWWIDGTGKTSAAFDFPFKGQVNKAFQSGNLSELVWMANGTDPQPAGMIHFGYAQYAVTFVDNHDTYRDNNCFAQINDANKSKILMANAFMLCSPGTPCVFLPHWQAYKEEISKMIEARNSVGVNNTSAVRVLKTTNDCYMAEVTGTKGKLVIKVGPTMDGPQSGYTDKDIVTYGDGYCIWTTNGGGSGDDPVVTPTGDPFTVYYDNSNSNWATPYIHYWGASESTWPGVAMSNHNGNIWSYQVPAGTTGLLFNAGDGDPTKTPDFAAVANHVYNQQGDQGVYDGGNGGNTGGDTDAQYVVAGTMNDWAENDPNYLLTAANGKYTISLGNLPAGTEFKVKYAEAGWERGSWGAEGDPSWTEALPVEIALNTTVNAWPGSSCNFKLTEDAQNAVLTFVPGSPGQITVTANGGDTPVVNPDVKYTVAGSMNGWAENDPKYNMTYSNGAYTVFVGDLPAETEFKVKIAEAGWEGGSYGAEGDPSWTEAQAVEIPVNTTVNAWNGSSCNFKLANAVAKAAISFVPSAAADQPGKITVTENSAIDDIDIDDVNAPAVFYNMQGVRVDNPQKGLYIRKQGNRVSKVLVK